MPHDPGVGPGALLIEQREPGPRAARADASRTGSPAASAREPIGLHRRRARVLGPRLRRHARGADPAPGNRAHRRGGASSRGRRAAGAARSRTSAPAAAASPIAIAHRAAACAGRRHRRLRRGARRWPSRMPGGTAWPTASSSSARRTWTASTDRSTSSRRIRPTSGMATSAGCPAMSATSRTSRCSAAPRAARHRRRPRRRVRCARARADGW